MSQIKVNCPECHKSVTLETEMLQQNDGKAVCSHCFHIFKLVKKTPKTAAGKKQPATAAAKSKNGKQAKDSKTAEPKLAKTVKAMSSQTRTQQQQPLHYREPKARSAKPMFAEVPQNPSPTVFNLLDRDSASAQLPQISLQPSLGTASARTAMNHDAQKNNITIHTDSLVFTLVGDNNTGTPAPAAVPHGTLPGAVTPGGVPPAPTLPLAVSAEYEINWIVASLAAMAVLIMQLFYWMLVGN